jgi:hypothetical protein
MLLHIENYASYKTFGKTFKPLKPKLVVSYLCNSDLQNAKELKQFSSSTLLMTCTMAILANMKYFGKKHVNTLDVERVHQRFIKGFTLSGLAMDI